VTFAPTAGWPRDNTCAAAPPDLPEHHPEPYGVHDNEQSDLRPELHTTPPPPPLNDGAARSMGGTPEIAEEGAAREQQANGGEHPGHHADDRTPLEWRELATHPRLPTTQESELQSTSPASGRDADESPHHSTGALPLPGETEEEAGESSPGCWFDGAMRAEDRRMRRMRTWASSFVAAISADRRSHTPTLTAASRGASPLPGGVEEEDATGGDSNGGDSNGAAEIFDGDAAASANALATGANADTRPATGGDENEGSSRAALFKRIERSAHQAGLEEVTRKDGNRVGERRAKALFDMLTQVLQDAADTQQGTGGNLERPPTPSATAFGERSATGAFGQRFRRMLARKKSSRGLPLDTDLHADRFCVVEGPPGAGKTTLLREVQRQLELTDRQHHADDHRTAKAWLWVSPTRDLRAETERKLNNAKVKHAHACTHEAAVRSLAEAPPDCDWEAVIVDECFLVGMHHIWLYAHLAPRAAILMLGNRWQVQTIEPFTPWQSAVHPGSTEWCRGADWYAQVNSLQLRDSYRFGEEIWRLARSILEKAGVPCDRVRARGPIEGTCDYYAAYSEDVLLSRLWLDARAGHFDLVSCVTNREMMTLMGRFENAIDPEGQDGMYVEPLMPIQNDDKQSTLGPPLGFKLWNGPRCVCRCTTAHRTIGMDTARAAFVYIPAGADAMGRIAQETGGHKIPAHLFTAVTRASNRMRLYLCARDAGQLARYAPALYDLNPAPGSVTLLAPSTVSAAPATEADLHDSVTTYRSSGVLIFGRSGPEDEITLLLLRTPLRRGDEPTAETITEGRKAEDASAPFTALRGVAEELLGMPEDTPPALYWARKLLENVTEYGWQFRHLGASPEDEHRSYIMPAEAAFAGGMDEAVQSFQPNKEATGVVLVRLGDLTGRETELVDRRGHQYRLRGGRHLGAGRVNAIRALATATATGAPATLAVDVAPPPRRRVIPVQTGPNRYQDPQGGSCTAAGDFTCWLWTPAWAAQAGTDGPVREYQSTRADGHRFLVGPSLLLGDEDIPGDGLYYAGAMGGGSDLHAGDLLGRIEGITLDEVETECDWQHACDVMLHRGGRDGRAPNAFCIIIRRRGWSDTDRAAAPGWRLVDMHGQEHGTGHPASPFAFANSTSGLGVRARLTVDFEGRVFATPTSAGIGGAPTLTGSRVALTKATELVWDYGLPGGLPGASPWAPGPPNTDPDGAPSDRDPQPDRPGTGEAGDAHGDEPERSPRDADGDALEDVPEGTHTRVPRSDVADGRAAHRGHAHVCPSRDPAEADDLTAPRSQGELEASAASAETEGADAEPDVPLDGSHSETPCYPSVLPAHDESARRARDALNSGQSCEAHPQPDPGEAAEGLCAVTAVIQDGRLAAEAPAEPFDENQTGWAYELLEWLSGHLQRPLLMAERHLPDSRTAHAAAPGQAGAIASSDDSREAQPMLQCYGCDEDPPLAQASTPLAGCGTAARRPPVSQAPVASAAAAAAMPPPAPPFADILDDGPEGGDTRVEHLEEIGAMALPSQRRSGHAAEECLQPSDSTALELAHFNRLQQHGGPVLQAIEARRGVANGDPPPRRDSAAGGAPRRSNNVKEAFTGLESMNLSPADDVAAHAAEGVLRATARVHISLFGGGGGAATGVALANQSSSFRENYSIKARLHGESGDGLPPALDGLKIVVVDSNAEALKIAALNLPPGTETVEHFITPDDAVPPGTCRDLVEAGRRPFSMDAGPPCQGLSVLGNQKGKDDERDGFDGTLEAIKQLQPLIVNIENVPNMLIHKEHYNRVVTSLVDLGYWVRSHRMMFSSYGVPQSRERLIISGCRLGFLEAPPPLPCVTPSFFDSTANERPFVAGDHNKAIPSNKLDKIKDHEHNSGCRGVRVMGADSVSRTLTTRNMLHTNDALRVQMPPGAALEEGREEEDNVRYLTHAEGAAMQGCTTVFKFGDASGRQVMLALGGMIPPVAYASIFMRDLRVLDRLRSALRAVHMRREEALRLGAPSPPSLTIVAATLHPEMARALETARAESRRSREAARAARAEERRSDGGLAPIADRSPPPSRGAVRHGAAPSPVEGEGGGDAHTRPPEASSGAHDSRTSAEAFAASGKGEAGSAKRGTEGAHAGGDAGGPPGVCESLATHIRIVVHDGRKVLALKVDRAHVPPTWGATDTNDLALPHSILPRNRTNLRHEARGFLAQQIGPIQDMELYLPPEARFPLRSMFDPGKWELAGIRKEAPGGTGKHVLRVAIAVLKLPDLDELVPAFDEAFRRRRTVTTVERRIVGYEIVDALNLEAEATPQAARWVPSHRASICDILHRRALDNSIVEVEPTRRPGYGGDVRQGANTGTCTGPIDSDVIVENYFDSDTASAYATQASGAADGALGGVDGAKALFHEIFGEGSAVSGEPHTATIRAPDAGSPPASKATVTVAAPKNTAEARTPDEAYASAEALFRGLFEVELAVDGDPNAAVARVMRKGPPPASKATVTNAASENTAEDRAPDGAGADGSPFALGVGPRHCASASATRPPVTGGLHEGAAARARRDECSTVLPAGDVATDVPVGTAARPVKQPKERYRMRCVVTDGRYVLLCGKGDRAARRYSLGADVPMMPGRTSAATLESLKGMTGTHDAGVGDWAERAARSARDYVRFRGTLFAVIPASQRQLSAARLNKAATWVDVLAPKTERPTMDTEHEEAMMAMLREVYGAWHAGESARRHPVLGRAFQRHAVRTLRADSDDSCLATVSASVAVANGGDGGTDAAEPAEKEKAAVRRCIGNAFDRLGEEEKRTIAIARQTAELRQLAQPTTGAAAASYALLVEDSDVDHELLLLKGWRESAQVRPECEQKSSFERSAGVVAFMAVDLEFMMLPGNRPSYCDIMQVAYRGETGTRVLLFDTHVNRQILRAYFVNHATAGRIPGLKAYLTDPTIVKCMHSHRNDARILKAYGIRLRSVLDTALCDALSRGKALHQGRNLGEALKDTLGVELPHKATMPRDERGIFRKRPAAPQTIEYCAHDVLYSVALGTEQRGRILQATCGSDVLDVAYAASDQCSGSCLGRANMFHLYVADACGVLMRPATEDNQMLPVHVSAGTGGRAIAASMLKELVVRVKGAAPGATARISQAVVVKHANDGVGVVRWSAGGPSDGLARGGGTVQPGAESAPRWVPWKLALGSEALSQGHRGNLLLVAHHLATKSRSAAAKEGGAIDLASILSSEALDAPARAPEKQPGKRKEDVTGDATAGAADEGASFARYSDARRAELGRRLATCGALGELGLGATMHRLAPEDVSDPQDDETGDGDIEEEIRWRHATGTTRVQEEGTACPAHGDPSILAQEGTRGPDKRTTAEDLKRQLAEGTATTEAVPPREKARPVGPTGRPTLQEPLAYLQAGLGFVTVTREELLHAQHGDAACRRMAVAAEAASGAAAPATRREWSEMRRKLEPRERRDLEKLLPKLQVIDGLLHHVEDDPRGGFFECLQVVVPCGELRRRIVRAAHDGSGHQGAAKTLALVNAKYWWAGMTKDICRHIERCETCVFNKRGRCAGTVHPPERGEKPGDAVLMDVVHLEETSEGGYDCVLVVIDRHSRRVRLFPAKKTYGSRDYMNILLFGLFREIGFPAFVITDRASIFLSEAMRAFWHACGITHIAGTAHLHTAVAPCERFNKTLRTMARATRFDSGYEWDVWLPMIELFYNAAPQDTLKGYSPFYLEHGRAPRLPYSRLFEPERGLADTAAGRDEASDAARMRAMWEAWNATDHAIHERQQRDKRRLDAARDEVVYKVGDLVAYARPIDQRHHKMLMPYFTAVYQIEEKRERDNYKLCMLGGKPIRGKWDGVVHVSQLKPHPGSHLISRIVRGELHEFADIVGHRRVDRELEYRVRWKGLTAAHDTWEPTENFSSTAAGLDALRAYLEAHDVEPDAQDAQQRAPTRQQRRTRKMDAEQDRGPSSGTAARARNITLHLTVPENGTTGMTVGKNGTDDVKGVAPNGAAATAGLKVGDRIREVNGKSPAVERKGLIGLLEAAVRPGEKITLLVRRTLGGDDPAPDDSRQTPTTTVTGGAATEGTPDACDPGFDARLAAAIRKAEAARLEAASRGATTSGGGEPAAQPEKFRTAAFEALSAPDHTAGDARHQDAAPHAVSNPAVRALKRVDAPYFVDNYVPVPCGRKHRGTRTAWRNEPSRARGREGGRLLKSLRISLRADEKVCQLLRARGTPEAEYDEAIDSWLLRHARHAAERDQWPNREEWCEGANNRLRRVVGQQHCAGPPEANLDCSAQVMPWPALGGSEVATSAAGSISAAAVPAEQWLHMASNSDPRDRDLHTSDIVEGPLRGSKRVPSIPAVFEDLTYQDRKGQHHRLEGSLLDTGAGVTVVDEATADRMCKAGAAVIDRSSTGITLSGVGSRRVVGTLRMRIAIAATHLENGQTTRLRYEHVGLVAEGADQIRIFGNDFSYAYVKGVALGEHHAILWHGGELHRAEIVTDVKLERMYKHAAEGAYACGSEGSPLRELAHAHHSPLPELMPAGEFWDSRWGIPRRYGDAGPTSLTTLAVSGGSAKPEERDARGQLAERTNFKAWGTTAVRVRVHPAMEGKLVLPIPLRGEDVAGDEARGAFFARTALQLQTQMDSNLHRVRDSHITIKVDNLTGGRIRVEAGTNLCFCYLAELEEGGAFLPAQPCVAAADAERAATARAADEVRVSGQRHGLDGRGIVRVAVPAQLEGRRILYTAPPPGTDVGRDCAAGRLGIGSYVTTVMGGHFQVVLDVKETCERIVQKGTVLCSYYLPDEKGHFDFAVRPAEPPELSAEEVARATHPMPEGADVDTEAYERRIKQLMETYTERRRYVFPKGDRIGSCLAGVFDVTLRPEFDPEKGGTKVIENKPYFNQGREQKEAILEMQRTFFAVGALVPSQEAHGCACVVVPKPKGGYRVAFDFRTVNAATVPAFYPLPTLQACLDRLGGARFMTALDMNSAFHQIPATPRASKVMSLNLPGGRYSFKCMAMGMQGASACFQAIMEEVLRGLDFVIVYIDDVLICSKTWEEHLGHLGQVLDRLASAGFTLRATKCKVGVGEVEFLGYVANGDGYKPSEANTAAIEKLPFPSNEERMRHFIGLVNFYASQIPECSIVMEPLQQRVQHKAKGDPSELELEAFRRLREALISQPVLRPPDMALSFRVTVDACHYIGMGAILSQTVTDADGTETERVVQYWSRRWSGSEQQWPPTDQEAAAVYLAVSKRWPKMLRAKPFLIITDCEPVTYMMEKEGSRSTRMAAWALELQAFSFTLMHRPGDRNTNADALSRLAIKDTQQTSDYLQRIRREATSWGETDGDEATGANESLGAVAASRGASSLQEEGATTRESVGAAANRTGGSPPQAEEKFSISLSQQRILVGKFAEWRAHECTRNRAGYDIRRHRQLGLGNPFGVQRIGQVLGKRTPARRALRSAYDEYLASMLRGDPPDLEAIASAASSRAELQHARVYVRCKDQLSPEQFADTLGRIKAAGPVFLGCNCRSVARDGAQHKPWCHGDSLRLALSNAQDEAGGEPPLGGRTWVPVAEKSTPSEP